MQSRPGLPFNLVFISLGLVLLSAASFSRAQEKFPTDADINRLLQNWVDIRHASPGIAVGIVDESGTHVYQRGQFAADSTQPINGDTVFEIGSISKAFTGILLAQSTLRGDLDLDDLAQKYLPAAVKLPTRDGKAITLRHLATHTSGLPRMPGNFTPRDPANPYADYTVDQMYAFLGKCKLNSVPGEKYEYSNLAMGLLGHILALRAGTNYEALVRRDICEPLKLADTRITLTPAMKKRLAPGHADGKLVKNWDIPTLAGAGAIRSTVNDMLKFVAANCGLVETPLRAAFEKSQVSRHDTGRPRLEVGLGWHIRVDWDTRFIWHNGSTGGYRAYAGFDKKQKRGVVVLVNSTESADDLGFLLLHPRTAVKVDPKLYDDYIGEYKLPLAGKFVVTRQTDRLFVKLDDQPTFELFPESETQFFLKPVDARVTFVKDAAGPATALILHQAGGDQKARRSK